MPLTRDTTLGFVAVDVDQSVDHMCGRCADRDPRRPIVTLGCTLLVREIFDGCIVEHPRAITTVEPIDCSLVYVTELLHGVQNEKESSMNQVQIEQKSYRMPPQEGFTVTHFLTVADIERSARFYEKVFGGRILSRGDSNGAPGYIQIANTWLIVNVGAGRPPRSRR
jgi:hypothetical protein